jgi:hypothetical protein
MVFSIFLSLIMYLYVLVDLSCTNDTVQYSHYLGPDKMAYEELNQIKEEEMI